MIPKILVCLHIFYHDQIEFFLNRLSNLYSEDWDLLVTWVNPSEETRQRILTFKPDAEFIEVENAGYDIWPFIRIVQTHNLGSYDFIVKLHTKSPGDKAFRINGIRYKGYEWRNELVDSLIGSKEKVKQLSDIFKNCPEVGMVCSRRLYVNMGFIEDKILLDEELKTLGFQDIRERRFCCGTMMALRPAVLEPIKSIVFDEKDFRVASKSHTGGTKAHIWERILSLLPLAAGYKVMTVGAGWAYKFYQNYRNTVEKAGKWIFTINRDSISGRKYLTILGFRIYL